MWLFLAVLAAVTGIGWIGFYINLKPLPYRQDTGRDLGSVPIPSNLPKPVERFARVLFGDRIPVVETAWVSGTTGIMLGNIRFPMRFQFFYEAGKGHYHLIELAWFGLTIVTVHERFQNGAAILLLPGGKYVENDPNTNAASNQGLWAESIWLPSIYFTDPRVRWEPVDDNTARLIIPGADVEEHFTLHFDAQTGLMTQLDTLRFQEATDKTRRVWSNAAKRWDSLSGKMMLLLSETSWEHQTPWAIWQIKDVRYNVDVSARLEKFGD